MNSPRHSMAALKAVLAAPTRSPAARDLLAVALFAVAVFFVCAAFDINERLMRWLLAHDRLPLLELPLVIFSAALGLGWCAARRWREYRAEMEHRRALEQRLRVAAKEAEVANRAKSEFLANMSHELRTPLNAVIGFSEALAGGHFGALTPRQGIYVQDIHDAGRHLLQLINDILDMSKLDAGRTTLSEEDVDVAQIIEEAVRLVRQRAQKAGITLTVEPIAGGTRLRADELRLRQILLNLTTNAVKFTPAQGRVTIRAQRRRDGSFAIEVADSGIGMRPEDVAVALTPFAQVENFMTRRQEGTGLGLPIVKALVDLHGGQLLISSRPSQGTTVTVVFPPQRVLGAAAQATQAA
jgi:signal transduction histidine kinase